MSKVEDSARKRGKEYGNIPDEVKRELTEDDYHAILSAAHEMETYDVYGFTVFPSCNYLHNQLWTQATNTMISSEEREIFKNFMKETFPLKYLRMMEKFRPGLFEDDY